MIQHLCAMCGTDGTCVTMGRAYDTALFYDEFSRTQNSPPREVEADPEPPPHPVWERMRSKQHKQAKGQLRRPAHLKSCRIRSAI